MKTLRKGRLLKPACLHKSYRTFVNITQDQGSLLNAIAEKRGVKVAVVVREAVLKMLEGADNGQA